MSAFSLWNGKKPVLSQNPYKSKSSFSYYSKLAMERFKSLLSVDQSELKWGLAEDTWLSAQGLDFPSGKLP